MIFPGIEISLSEGFHVIGLFDTLAAPGGLNEALLSILAPAFDTALGRKGV